MKNFFDCKDEKITEKAFFQSLIISVVSILLCLVALCSMTYAWFTGETSSGENTIKSGCFDLDISVTQSNQGTATAGIIEPTDKNEENGNCIYKLSSGTYVVVLNLNTSSTAKGHCIVEIGNVEKHTDVIIGQNTANPEEYIKNSPFTFTLVIKEENTVVSFKPHWGINADPFVKVNDKIIYSEGNWVKDSDDPTQKPAA